MAQAEGVCENAAIASPEDFPTFRETLLVLTFVAPGGKHAFCSRYDLGPWPLLKGIQTLSEGAHQVSFNQAHTLLCLCNVQAAAEDSVELLLDQPAMCKCCCASCNVQR